MIFAKPTKADMIQFSLEKTGEFIRKFFVYLPLAAFLSAGILDMAVRFVSVRYGVATGTIGFIDSMTAFSGNAFLAGLFLFAVFTAMAPDEF